MLFIVRCTAAAYTIFRYNTVSFYFLIFRFHGCSFQHIIFIAVCSFYALRIFCVKNISVAAALIQIFHTIYSIQSSLNRGLIYHISFLNRTIGKTQGFFLFFHFWIICIRNPIFCIFQTIFISKGIVYFIQIVIFIIRITIYNFLFP